MKKKVSCSECAHFWRARKIFWTGGKVGGGGSAPGTGEHKECLVKGGLPDDWDKYELRKCEFFKPIEEMKE